MSRIDAAYALSVILAVICMWMLWRHHRGLMPSRRWMQRLGRRGACLVFWGGLYCLIAWTLVDQPPRGEQARLYAGITDNGRVSLGWWAAAWGLVGACMVVAALYKRLEPVAFGAGSLLALIWGLGFFAGWVATGAYRGILAVGFYLALAWKLLVIAGWPEPPRRSTRGRYDADSH